MLSFLVIGLHSQADGGKRVGPRGHRAGRRRDSGREYVERVHLSALRWGSHEERGVDVGGEKEGEGEGGGYWNWIGLNWGSSRSEIGQGVVWLRGRDETPRKRERETERESEREGARERERIDNSTPKEASGRASQQQRESDVTRLCAPPGLETVFTSAVEPGSGDLLGGLMGRYRIRKNERDGRRG